MYYHGWPDHGVPQDVSDFLDMMHLMENLREDTIHHGHCPPIVVHCRCRRSPTLPPLFLALLSCDLPLHSLLAPQCWNWAHWDSDCRRDRVPSPQASGFPFSWCTVSIPRCIFSPTAPFPSPLAGGIWRIRSSGCPAPPDLRHQNSSWSASGHGANKGATRSDPPFFFSLVVIPLFCAQRPL